jgi:hypothetical protein
MSPFIGGDLNDLSRPITGTSMQFQNLRSNQITEPLLRRLPHSPSTC